MLDWRRVRWWLALLFFDGEADAAPYFPVVPAQAGGLHPRPLPPVLSAISGSIRVSVEGQGESPARRWLKLTTMTHVGVIPSWRRGHGLHWDSLSSDAGEKPRSCLLDQAATLYCVVIFLKTSSRLDWERPMGQSEAGTM
jgi:hypothetical protein